MKKYILTVLCLSLFLIFSGCAPKKVAVPFKGYALSPADVLKKISRTDSQKDTLKALANISVNTPKGRHSMKVALIVKKPSFLRVEAIPIIGPSSFFLSVSGNSLKVFLPKKGEFYIGQATRKNLTTFFPINLKVEDIVSILVGTPPRVKGQNMTLQGCIEGELYRIDVISKDKKVQSLWVDRCDNLVRIEALGDDGRILYRARLKDHNRISGISIPGKVMIMTGKTDRSSAHIRYLDVQLSQDQDMDANLFDLDIPAGIKPTFID